jgi:hypothetical protein
MDEPPMAAGASALLRIVKPSISGVADASAA